MYNKPIVMGSKIEYSKYNFGGEYIDVYGTLWKMNIDIFVKHWTEKTHKLRIYKYMQCNHISTERNYTNYNKLYGIN